VCTPSSAPPISICTSSAPWWVTLNIVTARHVLSWPLFAFNLAVHIWESGAQPIHASWRPPESTSQTTSRLVQPFLHSSQQGMPILYNGLPPPQKLPLCMRDLDPYLARGYLGPPESTCQNGISVRDVMGVWIPMLSHSDNFLQIRNPTDFQTHSDWDSGAHLIHGRWALVSPRRETTRALKGDMQRFFTKLMKK